MLLVGNNLQFQNYHWNTNVNGNFTRTDKFRCTGNANDSDIRKKYRLNANILFWTYVIRNIADIHGSLIADMTHMGDVVFNTSTGQLFSNTVLRLHNCNFQDLKM